MANTNKDTIATLTKIRLKLGDGIGRLLESSLFACGDLVEESSQLNREESVRKVIALGKTGELVGNREKIGKEPFNAIYKLIKSFEDISSVDEDEIEDLIIKYKEGLRPFYDRFKELHSSWEAGNKEDIDWVRTQLVERANLSNELFTHIKKEYKKFQMIISSITSLSFINLFASSLIADMKTINKLEKDFEQNEDTDCEENDDIDDYDDDEDDIDDLF